jgi:UV DNA damage endonuclease
MKEVTDNILIKRYLNGDEASFEVLVKKYLTIENDDRSYSVKDCLEISKETGIPVTFDNLHHELNNNGETVSDALRLCTKTWKQKDGVISVHYSNQSKSKRVGAHSYSLDKRRFKKFVDETSGVKKDIIFEIKGKQQAVFDARKVLK